MPDRPLPVGMSPALYLAITSSSRCEVVRSLPDITLCVDDSYCLHETLPCLCVTLSYRCFTLSCLRHFVLSVCDFVISVYNFVLFMSLCLVSV